MLSSQVAVSNQPHLHTSPDSECTYYHINPTLLLTPQTLNIRGNHIVRIIVLPNPERFGRHVAVASRVEEGKEKKQ